MSDAAPPRPGVHLRAFYAWDPDVENAKNTFPRPAGFEDAAVESQTCRKCGSVSHQSRACPEPFWTCRIRHCIYCGAVLLGQETEGRCCGAMSTAKDALCVTFQRRHVDPELNVVYAMTAFRKNTLALNCLFASALSFIDLSYTSGGGPSFLRAQGNTCIALPMPDSRYSFLWSEGPPNLNPEVHSRGFMKHVVQSPDVQHLATIL